jgi:hypothetical protein
MKKSDTIKMLKLSIEQSQAQIAELESQKSERFKPEIGEVYWYVEDSGEIDRNSWNDYGFDNKFYDNFNCYRTEELATKAAIMMKRNNAIIMACLIVDPDFVPDYLSDNQRHWYFYYSAPQMGFMGGWSPLSSITHNHGPSVSTLEKWEEAAALLEEWGIE